MFFYVLILIPVAFAIYVRLAPSSMERWHVLIPSETEKDMKGGAIRIVPKKTDTLEQLERALNNLPRTALLAGSVLDGHATYITRSKWMGFPDYTTIESSGGSVKMFARLRFGRQDLGVNAARLRKLTLAMD